MSSGPLNMSLIMRPPEEQKLPKLKASRAENSKPRYRPSIDEGVEPDNKSATPIPL